MEQSRRDLMKVAQCFSSGNKVRNIIVSPVGTAEAFIQSSLRDSISLARLFPAINGWATIGSPYGTFQITSDYCLLSTVY